MEKPGTHSTKQVRQTDPTPVRCVPLNMISTCKPIKPWVLTPQHSCAWIHTVLGLRYQHGAFGAEVGVTMVSSGIVVQICPRYARLDQQS